MALTFVPWNEIANGAMNSFSPLVSSSFQAAQSFICSLAQQYPGWMGVGVAPTDINGSLRRGILDRCGLPAPPASPPPWNGETCACVAYSVTVRSTGTQANGQPLPPVTATATGVNGPIYGIERSEQTTNQLSFIRHGTCTNGTWTGTTTRQIFSGAKEYQTAIVNIVREGTGTNCPLPSPTPIPSPTPPPPEAQRRDAPVTIAPNVTLSVPVVLVRPTVNVDISPQFEVNVGPLNFNFDLGGVTFDIAPSFNPRIFSPTVNLPGLPPSTPRPAPLPPRGGAGSCPPCPEVNLQPVIDRLELIKKYVRRPKTELETRVLGSGGSGLISLPARTRFVEVGVLVQPPNIRIQSGGSAGPDVFYQGWCSVGKGGKFGERIQLSYGENGFVVPVGCDSFSYTMYDGGSAVVRALVEKDLTECQTYECG